MLENYIAEKILDKSFLIHRKLGPGLLESVYEEILEYELRKMKFRVSRQLPIPLVWEEVELAQSFRADLIVDDLVVIELKSVEAITPVYTKQLLTYLKLTDLRLGLLINFNENLLKHGIRRVVNKL